MNVNVRKGLFRLWIVLSLIWIVVGIFLTSRTWGLAVSKDVTSYNLIQGMLNNTLEGDAAIRESNELLKLSPSEMKVQEVTVLNDPTVNNGKPFAITKSREKNAKEYMKQLKDLDETIKIQNRQSQRENIALIIFPPIGALVVGLSLLWAFKGFKEEPISTV